MFSYGPITIQSSRFFGRLQCRNLKNIIYFVRAQFGLSLFIFLVPHSLQYIIHKSQRIQRKNDKKSPDDWFICLINQRYDLFRKSSTKHRCDRIGNEQHPCWVPFLIARMYENFEWMFVVSCNCVCSETQSNGCGGHLMFKWILCSTPNNGRLQFVKQIIYKKKLFSVCSNSAVNYSDNCGKNCNYWAQRTDSI